jgi:hypothetical protein
MHPWTHTPDMALSRAFPQNHRATRSVRHALPVCKDQLTPHKGGFHAPLQIHIGVGRDFVPMMQSPLRSVSRDIGIKNLRRQQKSGNHCCARCMIAWKAFHCLIAWAQAAWNRHSGPTGRHDKVQQPSRGETARWEWGRERCARAHDKMQGRRLPQCLHQSRLVASPCADAIPSPAPGPHSTKTTS